MAKLEEKEVSGQEFVIVELKGMRRLIQRLERQDRLPSSRESTGDRVRRLSIYTGDLSPAQMVDFQSKLKSFPFIKSIQFNADSAKQSVDVEFDEPVPHWVAEEIFNARRSVDT